MNYSINRTQKASQMVNIICGLLFALFCFCYLTYFQNDYLALAQHYLSSGRNVSHSIVFPVLLTLGLTVLGFTIQMFVHLPIRFRALHWFPSFFSLMFVTSVRAGKFSPHSHYPGILTWSILILVFLCLYFFALRMQESRSENASFPVLCWPNLFIILIYIITIGYYSNTDHLLHDELTIERAVGEERWDDALDVIKNSDSKSRFISSMAVFALSQKGELGENAFDFIELDTKKQILPTPYDSIRPWNVVGRIKECLGGFPVTDMDATTYLEYLIKDTVATEHVKDYLLVSYLVDRNLDDFVRKYTTFYPPKDTLTHIYQDIDSIPQNFKQALVLSSDMDFKSVQICDTAMLYELKEFKVRLENASMSDIDPRKSLMDYRQNYWYYYFISSSHTKPESEQ